LELLSQNGTQQFKSKIFVVCLHWERNSQRLQWSVCVCVIVCDSVCVCWWMYWM
jgi:hypothetical protein